MCPFWPETLELRSSFPDQELPILLCKQPLEGLKPFEKGRANGLFFSYLFGSALTQFEIELRARLLQHAFGHRLPYSCPPRYAFWATLGAGIGGPDYNS